MKIMINLRIYSFKSDRLTREYQIYVFILVVILIYNIFIRSLHKKKTETISHIRVFIYRYIILWKLELLVSLRILFELLHMWVFIWLSLCALDLYPTFRPIINTLILLSYCLVVRTDCHYKWLLNSSRFCGVWRAADTNIPDACVI